ncbi:MAG: hypothetical protein BMS9Abin07_1083 [Acidimicrobiia bacterium]|nr:MAG: hypothetical protein BMS9Abin07_1083 [Acidimicrobiia bacterium]
MDAVLWFHQNWFFVAVVTTGVVGLWGVGLAVFRRPPNTAFGISVGIAISVMLIQVVAGVTLYVMDLRPAAFHVFYGVVIAVTFAIAYVYRAQLARKPALSYGLLLLFVMGLGIRAWLSV